MVETLKNNYTKIEEQAKIAAKNCGRNFDGITILPVSKTKPIELLFDGIEAGLTIFGENYAQEMKEKHELFEKSKYAQPQWHFIGGLQKSNVKYIAPFVDIIHSCGSIKIANEIDKRAKENNRIINCFLQVNTSGELSKSGCAPEEILELAEVAIKHENIKVLGLMTIGSFSNDESVIRSEFQLLKKCLENVNKTFNLELAQLSMGMSHDFPIAIDEGATIVRVGTSLFGARNYNV